VEQVSGKASAPTLVLDLCLEAGILHHRIVLANTELVLDAVFSVFTTPHTSKYF